MLKDIIELKYKETQHDKIFGFTILLSLLMLTLHLIFLIFYTTPELRFMVFVFSIILMISLLPLLLTARECLRRPKINYLEINNQEISIYRGLLIKRKRIALKDISEGRVLNDKLILIHKNEKETNIHLKILKIKDIDKRMYKLKCVNFQKVVIM